MLWIKYWKELGIALVGVLVLMLIYIKDNKITELETENMMIRLELDKTKMAISMRNTIIESNRVEYEKKLGELPKMISTIEKKYYPVEKEITVWRDSNATDCNGSMQYINTFKF